MLHEARALSEARAPREALGLREAWKQLSELWFLRFRSAWALSIQGVARLAVKLRVGFAHCLPCWKFDGRAAHHALIGASHAPGQVLSPKLLRRAVVAARAGGGGEPSLGTAAQARLGEIGNSQRQRIALAAWA